VHTLAPTVVVFNNGPRKGGEPGSIAVAKETPSVRAVYQVHRNVNEGALNTADAFIANKELACSGNFIHMSVGPDGRKYHLSVPATKHDADYTTRGPAGR
jgi:competence protein ComEC